MLIYCDYKGNRTFVIRDKEFECNIIGSDSRLFAVAKAYSIRGLPVVPNIIICCKVYNYTRYDIEELFKYHQRVTPDEYAWFVKYKNCVIRELNKICT